MRRQRPDLPLGSSERSSSTIRRLPPTAFLGWHVWVAFALGVGLLSGCAIHYYDSETGAEHVWGVGHLVMKASVPREGQRTIVRGTEVFGLAAGNVGSQGYVTVGWERRQRIEMIDENASVRLEWPRGDFFNVRVGSERPPLHQEPQ